MTWQYIRLAVAYNKRTKFVDVGMACSTKVTACI